MSSHSSSYISILRTSRSIFIAARDGGAERTFSYCSYFEKMPLKKFETESKNPGPDCFFEAACLNDFEF